MKIQPIIWKKKLLLFSRKVLKLELGKIQVKITENRTWLSQKASLQKSKMDEKLLKSQLLQLKELDKTAKKNLEVITKQTEKLENLEARISKIQATNKERSEEAEITELKTAGFVQKSPTQEVAFFEKESSFVSTQPKLETNYVALLEAGKEKVYIEYVKSQAGESFLSFDFNHNNRHSLNEFRQQIFKRLKGRHILTSVYINGNNS